VLADGQLTRWKVVFDVEYEKDQIVLIQSAILLSFWNADAAERTGSWYWNGVAISLCQGLGLHRDPQRGRSRSTRPNIPHQQCQLWRILWWSCYFREAWLALAFGRPMRVHRKDTDTPMPIEADMEVFIATVDPASREEFFPKCMTDLFTLWKFVLDLSIILGEILSRYYEPNFQHPSASEIQSTENSLDGLFEGYARHSWTKDDLTLFYHHHFEMLFE
jgi:hypothetical protein